MKMETYQDLEPVYTKEENYLHDWVFHYNTLTSKWAAIPREAYQGYWSDINQKGIIRSSNINTLIELVGKISYDPKFLDKIQ